MVHKDNTDRTEMALRSGTVRAISESHVKKSHDNVNSPLQITAVVSMTLCLPMRMQQ